MFMKFKMKKIFCVVLSALMMLSLFVSCGQADKDKAALSEIAQANATKKLLEVYDSVLITFEDISGMKFGYYVDEDIGYYWVDAYVDTDGETYDAYHEVTTADYQEGREGEKGYSVLYAGGEIDFSQYENMLVNPDIMALERLVKVTEQGDALTYQTKLTIVDLVDLGYVAEADTIKDYYMTEYTVDADTLHFTSITESYYKEDGTKDSGYTCTVEYNAKRPEMAQKILNERNENASLCTISVVSGMGTADEHTDTYTMPKGNMLYFYWYGNYQNVYLDRDCTKAFSDGMVINEDTSLYLK